MKQISQDQIIRTTAITGIIGAVTIILGSLISALFYNGRTNETYSFLNHFVSELGEVGVSDVPFIFNGGLIIGAFFLTLFLLGVAWLVRNWLGALFAVLALVTGISGLLVGVYPMNNIEPHITVAMLFFNTGQFTMLFFSVYVLFSKHPWFSKKLAIPGFITGIFFIVFLNMPSSTKGDVDIENAMLDLLYNRPTILPLAIFEWLIIAGLMSWVIYTCVHLWRFNKQQN
jgi:hypothetical protein